MHSICSERSGQKLSLLSTIAIFLCSFHTEFYLLFFFFKMVTVLASLHSWGTEPSSHACCISISKPLVSVAPPCFHISLGTPSTPGALPSPKESIARFSSFRVGISSNAVTTGRWLILSRAAGSISPGWLLSYYFECRNERDIHKALKRRLSSGKRWKIICEHYHSYYASVEEHHVRHVPWKAWLFKCLHIRNMSCNIVKLGGRIFTPRVRVVPYTSFCVQCL